MGQEIQRLQDELGFIEEHAKSLLENLANKEKNNKLTKAELNIKAKAKDIQNIAADAMVYLDIETNGNPWE